MRIDGMEAISFSLQRPNSGEIEVKTDDAPVIRKKRREVDIRNISQLTEFDKRELPISEQVVINAIERANKAISGINTKFEFSIHEKTKEIMVKVIDSDTNQIIREIPPEKILDMVAKMWEMAGLIVDERR